MEIVTKIAPIALALIMLGLGLGLTAQDFIRVLKQPKDFFVGAFSQVILFPLVALCLILFIPIDLTKSKVTVSLSGDGGDEIFGGYGRYFLGQQIVNSLGKIPYPIRKSIKSSGLINNSLTRDISNFLIGGLVSNFHQKFGKLNNIFDFTDESDLYKKLSTIKNCFLLEKTESRSKIR